jgi:hypothetical protein
MNPGIRGNHENTHSLKYYYNIYVAGPYFNKNLMEKPLRSLQSAKENNGPRI